MVLSTTLAMEVICTNIWTGGWAIGALKLLASVALATTSALIGIDTRVGAVIGLWSLHTEALLADEALAAVVALEADHALSGAE